MQWSHDTCKSADSCDFFFLSFFFLLNTTPLRLSLISTSLHLLSFFFSFFPLQTKKSFRIREETRMNSAPTHGNNESTDFILPPQQMQMQMQMQVSSYDGSTMPSAEWTDEKHSMYIKSIEASFVDQLYDFKETFGNCISQVQSSPDSTTVSSQFKVFQGGIWQENNFVRKNPQRSRLHECYDLKSNPWIQHYRSSCKQGISSEVPIVDTEMSDQNFADEEEVEGKKENNNTRDVKRFKSF